MKLHRICATNLNSLYGEQIVDLDVDLEGAGLFLIQGPTGSGKSTLMDAVSLGLFGTTPRLNDLRSASAIAEQIMSRGAGTARAEVEFSKWGPKGDARVRYRAAWAARRARDKPDGKMQQQVHRSIERRDDEGEWVMVVSDHRANVVDKVFNEVLDKFSMHDFQRSMLLAQGHFDAMLNAPPEERAAILERLTDTSIYQRLGERAARVRGAWDRRLTALRAAANAASPLTDAQLAEAHAQVTTGTAAVRELDAALTTLRLQQDWLSLDAQQAAALDGAKAQQVEAARQTGLAAEVMAQLAEHERCAEAFGLFDKHAEDAGRLEKNAAERLQVSERLPALQAVAAAAERVRARCEADDSAAEQALVALRPPARAARDAHHAATIAQGEWTRTQGDATRAQTAVTGPDGAQARLQRAATARDAAAAALSTAEAARVGCAADAPLAVALPALARIAAGIVEAREEAARREAELAARATQIVAQTQQLGDAQRAHELARSEQLTPLNAAAESASAALRALVGDAEPSAALAAISGQRDELRTRCEAMQAAQRALLTRDDKQARLQAAAGKDAAAAAKITQTTAAVALGEAQLVDATQRVNVAEAAVLPLRRIADLGVQRAALAPDDPCPLCGSEAHPFVADIDTATYAAHIDAELRQSQQTLDEAEAVREAIRRALAQTKEHFAACVAARQATAEVAEEARREADAAVAAAAVAVAGAGLSSDGSSQRSRERLDGSSTSVGARLAEMVTVGEELHARHTAVQAAIGADRSAQSALHAAEKALATAADALAARTGALAQAEQEQVQRTQALAAQRVALAERRAGLAVAFGGFGIDTEPAEAGLEPARARVAMWEQATQAVKDAHNLHDRAVLAHAAATDTYVEAQSVAAKLSADLLARRKTLDAAATAAAAASEALAAAWGQTLSHDAPADAAGAPTSPIRPPISAGPDALVASQERWVETLGAALRRATNRRDVAAADVVGATAALATLTAQFEALQQTLALAADALARQLIPLGLPDVSALTRARLPAGALVALRAQRDALRELTTQAQAHVAAAAAQRARHLAERPAGLVEDMTAEDLTPEVLRLTAAREQRAALLDQARATVTMAARDAERRAAATAKLNAATSRAKVWLELHELIGTGDGKRFKLFAQALNLHQLLTGANKHLEHLNNRYRLRIIKEPDTGFPTLEFLIEDRWRAGATRSLKTLSGGESFLVSLALALGLSDLRTSTMPVETLLLDEGFGTLDPQTLDIALAALQRLQASGRQVGIISHVVGLQESIEARILVEPIGEGRSRVRTLVGDA